VHQLAGQFLGAPMDGEFGLKVSESALGGTKLRTLGRPQLGPIS
jgi:hypothetical protein